VRFWCISTSEENWGICKQNSVWGMDARYYITLRDFVKDGDQAIVYTHGGKFVAIIQFSGKYFYSGEDIGWTKKGKKFLFPYRIKFNIIREAKTPIKIRYSTEERENKANNFNPNLIDKLTFIADKGKTWNRYVQVSIIRITKEDFNIIKNEINKQYNTNTKIKNKV